MKSILRLLTVVVLAQTLRAGGADSAPTNQPAATTPSGQQPAPKIASHAAAHAFKLVCSVTTAEQTTSFPVFIVGQYALEFDDDTAAGPSAIFDLDGLKWRETALAQSVTLAEAEAWATTTADQTRQNARSADAASRQLIEQLLEPNLKPTTNGQALVLANDVISYRVTGETDTDDAKKNRVFAYDKLCAYRKAMLSKRVPPNTQLAVSAELQSRNILPTNMVVTLLSSPVPQEPMIVSMTLEPLSAGEYSRVTNALVTATLP